MIVVCTSCQAKFKVADEKVGRRGAKVRCSRCQTVFLVHRDLGSVSLDGPPPATPPPAPPAVELDLEPGRRAPSQPPPISAAPDPFGGADPFAQAAPSHGVPALEDPFAAAAAPAPAPARPAPADPFAALMAAGPPPSSDPFAAGGDAAAAEPADPFAMPALTPPPSGTAPAAGPPGALPVTDLSDLMAGLVEQAPPRDSETSDPDFALDGRAAPRPRVSALDAAAEAAEVNVAAAAAVRHEPQFYSQAEEEPLKLATERTDPPPGRPLVSTPQEAPTPVHGTAAAPPPGPVTPARPRRRAPGATEQEAELAARTLAQQLPRLRRASRVRKILLNALALVVLVLLATALLVLVQSRGRLEPGALRPSAVLRALGGEPLGAFAALEVASGAYERAKGPPLLFVRGRAVSRAAAPVGALVVSVEVIRRGEVVARGRALAGAVPTPEELHGVADAAALAAVGRGAEARAPRAVNPGDEVPFLVAIADYPGDLEGAALRVSVAEAGSGGSP